MHARARSLSHMVLETFADARHPRVALAMICLSGFLAGSLTTAAVLLPEYELIVACIAPLMVLSLSFAILVWRRRGSAGGGGDGRDPRTGPRPPKPDRWRCPWYDTLWKDHLPDEPSGPRRTRTLLRR